MRLNNLHKQFVNLPNLPCFVFRWDDNRKQKEKEKEEEEEEEEEEEQKEKKERIQEIKKKTDKKGQTLKRHDWTMQIDGHSSISAIAFI